MREVEFKCKLQEFVNYCCKSFESNSLSVHRNSSKYENIKLDQKIITPGIQGVFEGNKYSSGTLTLNKG